MTPLVLLLACRPDGTDAVFARNARVMKTMSSFEVQVKYSGRNGPTLAGSLILDGKKRLFYHIEGPKVNYTLSISPAGYREVDRTTRMYDEFEYEGSNELSDSRSSPYGLHTLPSWLANPSFRSLLPKNASVQLLAAETISDHRCDHLQTSFTTMAGKVMIDGYVGDDGLVYRLRERVTAMTGNSEQTWDLSHYVGPRAFGADRFANPIPDGFAPYALHYTAGPAVIGTKPSLTGFVSSTTGAAWKAPAGRSLLLLVAGRDSLPSDRAVREVSGWRNALDHSGVTLAIASDAATRGEANGMLFNPGGKTIGRLSPPATPMFYLFSKTGELTNLWMGFQSKDAAKLRSEIMNAAKSLGR
ncbi:MAG: hypothetical protein P4L46_18380 [Fimbriimonas sp.]|nr:hypothetical protein [Fimbriimonas sp.]